MVTWPTCPLAVASTRPGAERAAAVATTRLVVVSHGGGSVSQAAPRNQRIGQPSREQLQEAVRT